MNSFGLARRSTLLAYNGAYNALSRSGNLASMISAWHRAAEPASLQTDLPTGNSLPHPSAHCRYYILCTVYASTERH
jgi:hypothetical protein